MHALAVCSQYDSDLFLGTLPGSMSHPHLGLLGGQTMYIHTYSTLCFRCGSVGVLYTRRFQLEALVGIGGYLGMRRAVHVGWLDGWVMYR